MKPYKHFFSCIIMLLILPVTSIAGNIDVFTARNVANNFLKHRVNGAPGSLNAPSMADITLSHAEPSSIIPGANDYYAFNISGGGWVIVAGDDRATQVLGYGDKGRFDINHMSEPLQDLLDTYKKDIEYLQRHNGDDLKITPRRLNATTGGVEPMTRTTWGPEMPYYLQCPMLRGRYSKVGCVGVAMFQMVYFWKYPISCGAIPEYFSSRLNATVPELPPTTFEYDKMLLSYCHWNWETTALVQDVYTDEQAQAVAKLARYCGQAAKINYSPDVSSTSEENKVNGMKLLGFNPDATSISSIITGYSTERWESLLRTELDAGRPVMYAFDKPGVVGHAFIIDGYDNEGYFHMNMGWYGTNDGWYMTTAITLTNRYGKDLDYSSYNRMILNLEPPLYCIFSSDEINANSDLLVLGDELHLLANNVKLNTSYRTVGLAFALANADSAQVATSEPVWVKRHLFEQGCNIEGNLALPITLAEGTYDLQFNCYDNDSILATGGIAPGKLVVVGKFAKYNADFDVSDVTMAIQYVLHSTPKQVPLDVSDIVLLINHILGN